MVVVGVMRMRVPVVVVLAVAHGLGPQLTRLSGAVWYPLTGFPK